jgi:inner membrane protein
MTLNFRLRYPMASAFGHILASTTVSKVLTRRLLPVRFWVLAALCGIIPDIDVLAFRFGIPYQHPLGHRGFTHSITFGVLWTAALVLIFFRKQSGRIQLFFVFLIATLSHGLLDAMTNGGLGVGFFIPWSDSRYFLPFRPIEVSPIHVDRFFHQAGKILLSEATWIGIPCLVLVGLPSLWKLLRREKKK